MTDNQNHTISFLACYKYIDECYQKMFARKLDTALCASGTMCEKIFEFHSLYVCMYNSSERNYIV